METLIILGFTFFATMAVFGVVDVMRQINRLSDETENENDGKNKR